jgi:hypothetical protein
MVSFLLVLLQNLASTAVLAHLVVLDFFFLLSGAMDLINSC